MSVVKRDPGNQIKFDLSGQINPQFTNVLFVERLDTGFLRKKSDGVTDLADDSTLQDWWNDQTKTDDQVWALAKAAGKVTTELIYSNVQLLNGVVGYTNKTKFYGNNIGEINPTDNEVEFIDLAASGDPLYVSVVSGIPTYDRTTGTLLSKTLTYGSSFYRARSIAWENDATPSPFKYSKLFSYDDFFYSDMAAKYDLFRMLNDGANLKFYSYPRSLVVYDRYTNPSTVVAESGAKCAIITGSKAITSPASIYSASGDVSYKQAVIGFVCKNSEQIRLQFNASPNHMLYADSGNVKLMVSGGATYANWTGITNKLSYVSTLGYGLVLVHINTNNQTPTWNSGQNALTFPVGTDCKLYTVNADGTLNDRGTKTIATTAVYLSGLQSIDQNLGAETLHLMEVFQFGDVSFSINKLNNLASLIKKEFQI